MVILGGFTNPASGVRTTPFEVTLYDSEYFDMATSIAMTDFEQLKLTLQMTGPYVITEGATLKQDTDIATSPVAITIQFTPKHDIPQDAKLVLTYPYQLG